MIPLPWRHVTSWNCTACGTCCKGFRVVIGFHEWVNIVRTYGVGVTKPGLDKLYLNRKSDDTCVFLQKFYDTWLCGLQHMKPKACKLWPFKIHDQPKYGRPNEAFYKYGERELFIYLDPACTGIRWGYPTREFAYRTVSELVEIALGIREKQFYSTSRMFHDLLHWEVKGRKII